MLKKHVKYTDYDNNEREEDVYFNLNKVEVTEMELGRTGGLVKHIEKIISAQSIPEIIDVFKEVMQKAYGEKSADGRRFVKSPELTKAFTETEAYVQIYMELAGSADAAAAFFNAIIPKDNPPPVSK